MTLWERRHNLRQSGRKLAAIFMFLALTGCGFHPVYGTHDDAASASVAAQMQQTAIDNIPERSGQTLRNALIDRMYGKGRPGQPLYRLAVKVRSTQLDVGVLTNAVSTLSDIDTYGDYVLTDANGKELLKGTSHSQTSYSRLNDQYATLAGHDSAVDRNLHEISEQIVNRISLYFSEKERNPSP